MLKGFTKIVYLETSCKHTISSRSFNFLIHKIEIIIIIPISGAFGRWGFMRQNASRGWPIVLIQHISYYYFFYIFNCCSITVVSIFPHHAPLRQLDFCIFVSSKKIWFQRRMEHTLYLPACIWPQNNIEKLLKIALYLRTAPSMMTIVKMHHRNIPWDTEWRNKNSKKKMRRGL